MNNISSREWSLQFETAKRQIQSKRSYGDLKLNEIDEFLIIMKKLEFSLKSMGSSPMENEISLSEVARREVILRNLTQVLNICKNSRYEFTPNVNSISTAGTGKGGSSSGVSTSVTMTDNGLKLRQVEVVSLQDSMILDLGTGIDKLYRQAVSIGDESKLQVRLLDNLDDDVESTTNILQTESRHAERVKDKVNICWMYICVAVEILVIIIILIVISSR
mmetsp:Transcript_35624/g.33781  ORF Transcript_35624/g.33781 Transcript_35624/m.33781 type:complete len:219 (+) Transcript_35624:224-880(+)